MNVIITLNSLIAKIYYTLIIFSFSQKRNLLKIMNSALKEKNKEKNKENKEDEENEKEEENNKKEKIIKKVKT